MFSRDGNAFTCFWISCGFSLPAAVCLSFGPFLCRFWAGRLMPIRYWGHRLLLGLVDTLSCQQLLHVVILILTSRAMAKVYQPCEESQQSQGGEEADALSCHDPGGLSPAVSPDVVSRGACCCCGAASHQLLPFPLQCREFTKFSKRSKSLTKGAEPEGPLTRQSGKNAVREGGRNTESRRWGRGEGRGRETDSEVLSFRCWQVTQKSDYYRFKPVQAADILLSYFISVGRSEKEMEITLGIIHWHIWDLLSSPSPPTLSGAGFTVR